MPSASSFINKIRAGSEGRNTKVEYNGGVTQMNSLSPIGCSQINRWVDTEYQEKSIITCNDSNPKVTITKPFAVIDNNTGLVSVSWKKSTHYNSYVILYKSDGTLIETKETDGYTRFITFSTLSTSGYSYYATITSAGSSVTTNTVQFIDIIHALASIDSNGLVNISWKKSTHYNSYVIFYKSDGTLIETKETDGYTRFITISTLLTSGYSYYATVTSSGTAVTTNTLQFIYKDPIYIGRLATGNIPYSSTNPYIYSPFGGSEITTLFFSTYPTLVQIDYFLSNSNPTSYGILVASFTIDTTLMTPHSYICTNRGWYYSVVTPFNKNPVRTSNTIYK